MEIDDRILYFACSPPTVAENCYVAPSASLIGDVTLCEHSSVWFQSVLRADLNSIRVGPGSNIQDGAVIHVSDDFPTIIGARVTVGHSAVLHACTVGDEVLIGMNSVVLDGAEVGPRSIIGANALVTAGTKVPPGSLFLGSPGRVIRTLTPEEQEGLATWAERYITLAKAYSSGKVRPYRPSSPDLPVSDFKNP
jgi:carbonic anhydrase/acetyltransferase-like protein (isoleucine patch superfamily)